MSLEDSMRSTGFTVNIPSDEHIIIDEENIDDEYTATVISQQVLEYLAAKLKGMEGRVTTAYNRDIIQSYKKAVEYGTDIFLSMRVKLMPQHQDSIALIQFFQEPTQQSHVIAGGLAYRMNKTDFFIKVDYKEEDAVMPVKDAKPSAILALCIGNRLLCKYNTDPDTVLSKIVDAFLFTIVDIYGSESE